jgi:hypothetical protein
VILGGNEHFITIELIKSFTSFVSQISLVLMREGESENSKISDFCVKGLYVGAVVF